MTKEEQLALARDKAAEVNKGNDYSSKINRILGETLKRKLIQNEAKRANRVIEALLDKAEDGDVSAIKEVFDRTDGKVMQESKISGDEDAPIRIIKVSTGINV